MEGENSTSGPQPYQPYEAEVTNSPISNRRLVTLKSVGIYGNLRIHPTLVNSGDSGYLTFSHFLPDLLLPRKLQPHIPYSIPHMTSYSNKEGCWSLHPELAPEHLQEKFNNGLESQARDSSARIGSMTARVRRTVIG